MSRLFEGEVVVITGGSSGIGRATAIAFAREGARVAVASRRAEESEETVRLVEAEGSEAIFIRTDVARAAEVENLIAKTVERFGGLNYAFNNAGIEGEPFVPIEKYDEAMWDQVIDINLKGVFLSMKYELPHIRAREGAIVNMASVAGLAGTRIGSAYAASKHGVVGLTRAAAMENAERGVRINAVAPAVIRTPMADRAFFQDPAVTAAVTARHPMGRVGLPEEVANAVVWLCSKHASFTTGHIFPIDGGFLVP
jgi:NAD(P)-dependent dehydrogenase (short-subunit alcohol dehydrogenase family)